MEKSKKGLIIKILLPVIAVAVFIGVFLAVGLNPTYGDNFLGGNGQEVSNTAASTPTVTISNTNFSGGTKHLDLVAGTYNIVNCTFTGASGTAITAGNDVDLTLTECTIQGNGKAIVSYYEVYVDGGNISGNDGTLGDFYQNVVGSEGDTGIDCLGFTVDSGAVVAEDIYCSLFHYIDGSISGNVCGSTFNFDDAPSTLLTLVPDDIYDFEDGADLGAVAFSSLNLENVRLFYVPSWSADLPAASNCIGVTCSGSTLTTYWDRYKVNFYAANSGHAIGTAVEVKAGTTVQDALAMYAAGSNEIYIDASYYANFHGTVGAVSGFNLIGVSEYEVITKDTDIFGFFDSGALSNLFDGLYNGEINPGYFENIRSREILWVATERNLTVYEAKLLILLEEFIFNTEDYLDENSNIDFDALFNLSVLDDINETNVYDELSTRERINMNYLQTGDNSITYILNGIKEASNDDMGVDPSSTWDLYFPASYNVEDIAVTNYSQFVSSPSDAYFGNSGDLTDRGEGYYFKTLVDGGEIGSDYIDDVMLLAYNNKTRKVGNEFYMLCPDNYIGDLLENPNFCIPEFDLVIQEIFSGNAVEFQPHVATANPSSMHDVDDFMLSSGIGGNTIVQSWCIASTDFLFIFECYRWLKYNSNYECSTIYSSSYFFDNTEYYPSWDISVHQSLNFYNYVWACDVRSSNWDIWANTSAELSMSDLIGMFMSKLCIAYEFQAFEEARARLNEEAADNNLGLSYYALWEILDSWLPFSWGEYQ